MTGCRGAQIEVVTHAQWTRLPDIVRRTRLKNVWPAWSPNACRARDPGGRNFESGRATEKAIRGLEETSGLVRRIPPADVLFEDIMRVNEGIQAVLKEVENEELAWPAHGERGAGEKVFEICQSPQIIKEEMELWAGARRRRAGSAKIVDIVRRLRTRRRIVAGKARPDRNGVAPASRRCLSRSPA